MFLRTLQSNGDENYWWNISVVETNSPGKVLPVAFCHSTQQLGPNGFLRAAERRTKPCETSLLLKSSPRKRVCIHVRVRRVRWDLTITAFIYNRESFTLVNGLNNSVFLYTYIHTFQFHKNNPIERIFKSDMVGYGLSAGKFATIPDGLEPSPPVIC